MQQIIDYIIANWQWLLPIVLSVVEFIILFIFRRDKLIDPSFWKDIIFTVSLAEDVYKSGHGEDKLKFVVDYIKSIHPYWSEKLIKAAIEAVLSTPTKKGGK